ncbi:MAG: hypothetical protein HRT88_18410 [Lentisphaeraceae bacterium]|nr:hypothetical protein [Lentisphaeraceae bacterium]
MKTKHWAPPLSALIIYGLWHMAAGDATQQSPQHKQSRIVPASQTEHATESTQAQLPNATKQLTGEQLRSQLRKQIVQQPAIDPNTGKAVLNEEYIQKLNNIAPQQKSPTHIDIPIGSDFHYRTGKGADFNIQSTSNNGLVRPYIRFTVENQRGNILLESSTDSKGNFTGKLPVYHNTTIYARFYGAGIPQEKVKIQLTGAAK